MPDRSRVQPDPAAPRDANPVDDDRVAPGDNESSAPGSHHRGARSGGAGGSPVLDAVGHRAQRAHRAVQPGEHLLGQGVDPVHDRLGPRVGGPRLALLLVGEGQRAQREDLVDLARVVQVAGALGRDAGVVVHDDRRGQHDVPPARCRPPARGTCAGCGTPSRPPPPRPAGPAATGTTPSCTRQHAVGGDEGAAQHLGARRVDGLVGHGVLDVHAQPPQRERRRGVRDRQPQPRRQRPPGAHHPAVRAASPNGSVSSPPGAVISSTCSRSSSSAELRRPRRTPAARPRRTSGGARRPTSSSSTSTNSPSAPRRRTERCCSCRNRSRTRSRAPTASASSRHSVRCRHASAEPATRLPGRAARLDPVPRARARRTASAPGSSRTTSGTGRAGSPRTAPRPPPRAPTPIPRRRPVAPRCAAGRDRARPADLVRLTAAPSQVPCRTRPVTLRPALHTLSLTGSAEYPSPGEAKRPSGGTDPAPSGTRHRASDERRRLMPGPTPPSRWAPVTG